MSAKLAVGVMIRHPDSGAPVFLRAGSAPPAWAVDRLGAHVFAGEPPSKPVPSRPAGPEPEQAPASSVEPPPEAPSNEADPVPVSPDIPPPPPRVGRGSSSVAWREWALAIGLDLTTVGDEDAKREQIVALARGAGILR